MGGGDLNLKKSWHPQTLKNIERVYLREKAADDEKKKIEQKRKEIEEQRAHQELQALHEASGKVKKRQERLEWIYAGPAAAEAMEEEREAYLLGKKRIDKLVEQGTTVDEMSTESTFSATDALIYGSNANNARDMQNKIREDPLLAIKRREQASLQSIINNPVRLKALKAEKEAKSVKKEKKKKDKDSKKGKKDKKKKSHRSGDEDEEVDEDGRHGGASKHSRKRDRSPPSSSSDSEEEDRRVVKKRHESSHESRHAESDRRVSPHRNGHRHHDDEKKRDERRYDDQRVDDRRHDERRVDDRRRDDRRVDDRRVDDRNASRSDWRSEQQNGSHRESVGRDRHVDSRHSRGGCGESYRRDDRGGRVDHRDYRRDDRDREHGRDEERRSSRDDSSTAKSVAESEPKPNPLDEARKKRLEAMMQNAKESDLDRQKRIAEGRKREIEEAKRETELQLKKLKEGGGERGDEIQLGGSSGLTASDMIRRNRHTVQRGDDSFLSR
ncbi:UNVERIFIED_CONTAM: RNA-splicing factor [Siphonaria sp. JEL0065]|nr:RNA-splicing factor [Siphonaria sp. JEL0065]